MPVHLCGRHSLVQSHSSSVVPDGPVLPVKASSCSSSFYLHRTEQKWHKPRTMGITPGPVNDIVILSARPRERKLFKRIRFVF
ncbi:hypothetical protein AMECASPLE_030312 [Ameca splendens]|uniref:Uncharacterized protein n=1 Tax=Ameca splendens TaxID=208324 RepID=A0ABV0Z3V8_9TELE